MRLGSRRGATVGLERAAFVDFREPRLGADFAALAGRDAGRAGARAGFFAAGFFGSAFLGRAAARVGLRAMRRVYRAGGRPGTVSD